MLPIGYSEDWRREGDGRVVRSKGLSLSIPLPLEQRP